MNERPKFSLVEIIFVTPICIVIDILSAIADIAAGVGGFIIQALFWLIFVFWFKLKGVEKEVDIGRILKKIGIQFVPFFPTFTFTFLYTAYKTNKESKTTEEAGGGAEESETIEGAIQQPTG